MSERTDKAEQASSDAIEVKLAKIMIELEYARRELNRARERTAEAERNSAYWHAEWKRLLQLKEGTHGED